MLEIFSKASLLGRVFSTRPFFAQGVQSKRLNPARDELSQKAGQLKLVSADGKKYFTDVTDTETLLRIFFLAEVS